MVLEPQGASPSEDNVLELVVLAFHRVTVALKEIDHVRSYIFYPGSWDVPCYFQN